MNNQKTYYKGDLVVSSLLSKKKISSEIARRWRRNYDLYFLSGIEISDRGRERILAILDSIVRDCSKKVEYEEFQNLLNQFFKSKIKESIKESNRLTIIGELVKGDDGNTYIEELHTKRWFPIGKIYQEYQLEKQTSKEHLAIFDITVSCNFKLTPISSFEKLDVIVYDKEVADKNEVLAYENQFKTFLGHSIAKERKFRQKLEELHNKNIFNKEVKREEIVKKEYPKPKTINSLMIEIDYKLNILRLENNLLYQILKVDYDKLLTSNITLQEIALFLGRIEASIKLDKKCANNIIEYASNIKEQYLNNFKNNIDESLLNLDEIEENIILLLKSQDNYTYLEIRNCLKIWAYIYLFELYVERNTINLELLTNTYFMDKEFQTLLISCLIEMQEEELIEKEIVIVDFAKLNDASVILNLIIDMKKIESKQKIKN